MKDRVWEPKSQDENELTVTGFRSETCCASTFVGWVWVAQLFTTPFINCQCRTKLANQIRPRGESGFVQSFPNKCVFFFLGNSKNLKIYIYIYIRLNKLQKIILITLIILVDL